MRFRIVVVAVAAILLSGCGWVGPPLYKGDPADAGPIRPGRYKVDVIGDGKPAHFYRVAWLSDGSTSWTPLKPDKDEKPWRQISVRLAMPGRRLWILQGVPDADQAETDYGLAEMHADALWAIPFIDCSSTAEIVSAAGGEVDDSRADNVMVSNEMALSEKPKKQRCRFRDRESLERALRAYIATNPTTWVRVRFKRMGD